MGTSITGVRRGNRAWFFCWRRGYLYGASGERYRLTAKARRAQRIEGDRVYYSIPLLLELRQRASKGVMTSTLSFLSSSTTGDSFFSSESKSISCVYFALSFPLPPIALPFSTSFNISLALCVTFRGTPAFPHGCRSSYCPESVAISIPIYYINLYYELDREK